jgi:hypothetical protein
LGQETEPPEQLADGQKMALLKEELELELAGLHRHQLVSQTWPGPQLRPGSPHCSPGLIFPLPQKGGVEKALELLGKVTEMGLTGEVPPLGD